MKKFSFVVLVLFLVFAFGCSNDNGTSPTDEVKKPDFQNTYTTALSGMISAVDTALGNSSLTDSQKDDIDSFLSFVNPSVIFPLSLYKSQNFATSSTNGRWQYDFTDEDLDVTLHVIVILESNIYSVTISGNVEGQTITILGEYNISNKEYCFDMFVENVTKEMMHSEIVKKDGYWFIYSLVRDISSTKFVSPYYEVRGYIDENGNDVMVKALNIVEPTQSELETKQWYGGAGVPSKSEIDNWTADGIITFTWDGRMGHFKNSSEDLTF